MYRINNLQRPVLITTDEVIFHAPTKHTLDPRTIENSIIIAEERFISPALCPALYEELIEAKNVEVTDANKSDLATTINNALPEGTDPVQLANGDIINAMEFLSAEQLALWKRFLWKLTAECVMMTATPEAFVQFGSDGVIHTSPVASPLNTTGISTPELKSVRWIMDKKMMDRIDPLVQGMHTWICAQKAATPSKYISYCKHCDCDASGVAYKRKTDWITGLYDDDDHKCGCR